MSKGTYTDAYSITDAHCKVSTKSILCDAGLIIARFADQDKFHGEALDIFDSAPFDFMVPISALIEAYHAKQIVLDEMFSWLFTPGAVALLPEDTALTEEAHKLNVWSKRDLDLVDCLLLVYSKAISSAVGLSKYVPIVTVDERMIWRAKTYDDKFRFISICTPDLGGAKWQSV